MTVWALLGWLVALGATAAALMSWRVMAGRREAVARAAHQLRGPLTAVRLGLELEIRSRRGSSERLRAIDAELDGAALALDDLLAARDTVRARQGATGAVDLHTVAAGCVEAWRAAAGAAGSEIRIEWGSAASMVRGDRDRLMQAVGILLANAVEHGGGSVDVRGATHRGALRLEVVDDGPGLPAPVSQLARRAGRGRTRAERIRRRAGRGRGLAIAQDIARAHGGRLFAAPSERGARMVLELPLAAAGTAVG